MTERSVIDAPRPNHLPRRLAAGLAVIASAALLGACSGDEPDLVAGKQLFVEKCGSCHKLDRAGTQGTQGPDLDESFQQALAEGFGESAVRGVVAKQIKYPFRGTRPCEPDCVAMPADLVTGDDVGDVAAYVASVVAKKGEDTGLLATAVKKAGSDEPIAARNGVLTIPADPGGQLAYASTKATAPAGALTVRSPNESSVPHDIVIDGKGKGEQVTSGGISEFKANFTPGDYAYYCSVPGHREAGMEGTLTVN